MVSCTGSQSLHPGTFLPHIGCPQRVSIREENSTTPFLCVLPNYKARTIWAILVSSAKCLWWNLDNWTLNHICQRDFLLLLFSLFLSLVETLIRWHFVGRCLIWPFHNGPSLFSNCILLSSNTSVRSSTNLASVFFLSEPYILHLFCISFWHTWWFS